MSAAAKAAPSIPVSELKGARSSAVTAWLREAAAKRAKTLDVVNRGRPVAHLALAEDMPAEWRATKPATVPLSELKRSEISISGLRREGRALYLSQRSGPTLALWPVEGSYVRSEERSLPEEVDRLREEVNRLRREVDQLKHVRREVEQLRHFKRGLAALGKLMATTLDLETTEKDAEPEEDS
jgi:hypothetical protein